MAVRKSREEGEHEENGYEHGDQQDKFTGFERGHNSFPFDSWASVNRRPSGRVTMKTLRRTGDTRRLHGIRLVPDNISPHCIRSWQGDSSIKVGSWMGF